MRIGVGVDITGLQCGLQGNAWTRAGLQSMYIEGCRL